MKEFVVKIMSNDIVNAKNILDNRIKSLFDEKLDQIKIRLAAELYEEVSVELEFNLDESTIGSSNVMRTGRTRLIKVRVRKGKIQRQKKFSAVKGYTIRGGKMVRMMPAEKRHRQIASGKSKFKRIAKIRQSLRKRTMSLRKRRTMGI